MPSLVDEVVLVTGGARGIGSAIAQVAARQGAAVAIVDVSSDGQLVADSLGRDGNRALFVQTDITDEEAVTDAVARVAQALGDVTVLVNNAGRAAYFDAMTMTSGDWDHVFDVDLKSAWLLARAVLPAMTAARHGSIVNIASIHTSLTVAGMFPYAAAKTGLVGMTRSLALDVAKHGVRVNAVSPGFVDTYLVQEWLETSPDPVDARRKMLEMHPLGRIGTPDQIAEVVCFLASEGAAFVTGAEWRVDGGLGVRFA
jgi:NAD(P)-dependent dehydrogenase (short-subunit alcohol dehydrogenase family)